MRHEEWNEVQPFREPTQELVNVRRVLSQTRQEHPGILAVCLGRIFRSIVALKSGTTEPLKKFRGSRREKTCEPQKQEGCS